MLQDVLGFLSMSLSWERVLFACFSMAENKMFELHWVLLFYEHIAFCFLLFLDLLCTAWSPAASANSVALWLIWLQVHWNEIKQMFMYVKTWHFMNEREPLTTDCHLTVFLVPVDRARECVGVRQTYRVQQVSSFTQVWRIWSDAPNSRVLVTWFLRPPPQNAGHWLTAAQQL